MGILKVLGWNVVRAPRTRAPSDAVPCPAGFRGPLRHDAACCTGCGTCAYVCSPRAIAVTEDAWAFAAERCTFCGRCAAHCPTAAIDFTPAPPPVVEQADAHAIADPVRHQVCAACGRPVTPMPPALLARLHGAPVPDALATLHRLCDRCRRRSSAAVLRPPSRRKEGRG